MVRDKDDLVRWESAKVRARARVRHLCRCLGADHLWTFGKRGKFESLDAAWVAWKEFCRLMGVRFKSSDRGWEYVVVPELHADGVTWHLHAAVHGFWDVRVIRLLWHRALGAPGQLSGADSPGNVDVKLFRGRSAAATGAYISKYVGKGFGAVASGRRLFASVTGLRPLERCWVHFGVPVSDAEVRLEVVGLLRTVSGVHEWEHFEYGAGASGCMVFEEWVDRG